MMVEMDDGEDDKVVENMLSVHTFITMKMTSVMKTLACGCFQAAA